jgi:hypothetical protein
MWYIVHITLPMFINIFNCFHSKISYVIWIFKSVEIQKILSKKNWKYSTRNSQLQGHFTKLQVSSTIWTLLRNLRLTEEGDPCKCGAVQLDPYDWQSDQTSWISDFGDGISCWYDLQCEEYHFLGCDTVWFVEVSYEHTTSIEDYTTRTASTVLYLLLWQIRWR